MNYGTIPVEDFSLSDTIESGQTFLWNRTDGQMFNSETQGTYWTCVTYENAPCYIKVSQNKDTELQWESNCENIGEKLKRMLGLNINIGSVKSSLIDLDDTTGVMEEAIDNADGLRIVNDPLFPCLISFICSTQMRITRIHKMVNNIKKNYGNPININECKHYTFPDSRKLSNATENELRDMKLGYRAPYVLETSENFDSIDLDLSGDVESARTRLKQFKGVGTKVADCVLLYGTNRTDVVPVDTWIESAVEKYYPDLYVNDNEKIARNLEDKFGEYSGFAQAYLFQYVRD